MFVASLMNKSLGITVSSKSTVLSSKLFSHDELTLAFLIAALSVRNLSKSSFPYAKLL